jgi:hypothetical protein
VASPRGGVKGRPNVMKTKLVLISMAIASIPVATLGTPLGESSLYKALARDCRTLDLKHWSHPTRHVLEHAEIEIKKVELCNHDLYPVFTVAMKYDPNGPNGKYYNRLFAAMAEANGFHSFSIVDIEFGMIVNIAVKGKHEIAVDFEELTRQEKP